jgi:hypothetical protein
MPSLNMTIPEERQQGFIDLIQLNKDDFERLLANLKSLSLTGNVTLNELTEAGIKDHELEIVDSILPLYYLQSDSTVPVNEFVREVRRAVEEALSVHEDLEEHDYQELEDRLIHMLNIEKLNARIKARSLLLGHEHIFHGSRVFTDLRPVFGHLPEQSPLAYVISNMLKISYYNDEHLEEFFIALDANDIQELIDTLERAKVKVKSLKATMTKMDLPYIDIS